MPFPYRYICDLLQQLDDASRRAKKHEVATGAVIEAWFREHRSRLDAPENDASATLSTLLPERRTDRVYLIQTSRLERIFGRALLLGASRVQELRRYLTPGLGLDLADCVEGILTRTPNAPQGHNEPTVEEIDDTLGRIAAACRFSSPLVRAMRKTPNANDQDECLTSIYRRLSARDAKWFTRLVLKSYQPVVLDNHLVFRCYHVLLPQVMKVRDDFAIAAAFLQRLRQSPHDQSVIASSLKPSLGTKVGRQPWFKGRSIKHCMDMGRLREVSCEQKIDGEYCQIHIDLRRSQSIQIFSKSGKDSTRDRIGLHRSIRDSLQLGTRDCPLKVGCILEGELVVYGTEDHRILPFHKIRKHVSRSGVFLGTSNDSQPHPYEHLMIVYYDVLMIDDESLLGVRHSERFKRLSELVTCRTGYAELVAREVISFSRPLAALKLREAFARCIISRNEGLVLKPDEPYFDFSTTQRPYGCCNIKLKKEYVQGWGDVGDFAVVGASYDAAKAREYKMPNVKWTHFFIGCLENREAVRAKHEKPRFTVTNIVELSEAHLSMILTQCFPAPVSSEANESIILDFRQKEMVKRPSTIFLEPLVFDMCCFSFDKRPNTNFWSMRFPTVSKIHQDRSYLDTISFSELQDLAANATEIPETADKQEMLKWVSALEKADPRGIAVDAASQQSTFTQTRASSAVSLRRNYREEEPPVASTPEPTEKVDVGRQSFALHTNTVSLAHIPITPPGSSTTENGELGGCPGISENSPMILGRRKRPCLDTEVTRAAKRLRKLSDASAQAQSGDGLDRSPPDSQRRDRQPLSQIGQNALAPPNTESGPRISERPASSPAGPLDTASQTPSRPPSHTHTGRQNPTAAAHGQPRTRGHCSGSGSSSSSSSSSPFAQCSILLSPCISRYTWVTENLLRGHGVTEFVVDPRQWTRADEPSPRDPSPAAASWGTKTPRARKICLVEARRPEATAAFARAIEAAGLRRRGGRRDWVAVYDWRILEDLAGRDPRARGARGADPWRERYVGIA
ncbi:hypothetical protein GGS23DRAFT_618587 [Durotheca rogersii]|uniref:uncharacterized protein n=1 Tax=Durotheca rogersii TaxID=419775 RepID=UPI00221FD07D|nr:uncharacterized protein GGS23DRAFT_618587 [Durotheca rogersii]KAI5865511.1 hypothetical protein GGS23DRAFT_618587 [Durotheca rogersii]